MELSEVTMVKNVIKSLNVLIFVWAGENGNIKYIHSFNRIDDFLPLSPPQTLNYVTFIQII